MSSSDKALLGVIALCGLFWFAGAIIDCSRHYVDRAYPAGSACK